MPVQLNHTIVAAQDPHASATFLAEILGLPAPVRFGHFEVVALANGVSLDYIHTPTAITPQHYAFLISEAEFDEVLARVKARGLPIYAEPTGAGAGEINRHWGGRGFYFPDPNGHWLEVITRPYGSEG
ncbi:VOC family protein [Archangium sp.]|jgi:catechol 2,3-dioxygenase-like lactoylglutathione lyase family enzyme|uniref:VOC family protein n=1 Tax=Archangium sp. TaxID=1872627 RepID=UPI002EDAD5B6